MKKLYFLILLLISSFSSSLIAQKTIEYKDEIINQLDENNKQTGLWKLYDDEKNILITCSFKDGNYASNTNYYKDSKLIASYDNFDIIEIYKKGKTIKASFFKRPDNATTLVDDKGKELDTSIIKYFFQSGQALPIYYGGMSKFYEYIRGKTNFRNKEKFLK